MVPVVGAEIAAIYFGMDATNINNDTKDDEANDCCYFDEA